jgi:hypothetical protein
MISSSQKDKYRKHFERKIVKNLEKNMIAVIDPSIQNFDSKYRKMHYELPEKLKHQQILEKTTLNNIHMFSEAC